MSFEKLEFNEIRDLITSFNMDISAQQLKSYYGSKTYFDILGVGRKETSHSSFIAWILDPQENHGLKEYCIRRFLEIIVSSKFFNNSILENEIVDHVITGSYEIIKSFVKTEKSIDKNSRIDIYIELEALINSKINKLRIIIENKVKSRESNDQTQKYYEYYLNNVDEYKNIFVYLTPISSIDLLELYEPECACKKYIQINYQMIVDYILDNANQQNIENNIKYIIDNYIRTLSQPFFTDDVDDSIGSIVMAIGERERNLLTKFWESNEKLIMATLYAISSDPNQEKDIRENISGTLESISSSGSKNKSSIIIRYANDEYKIIKADIGYQTVHILQKNNLINDGIIRILENDKSCGFNLIKEKKNITEDEIKYKRYRTNNEPEFIFNGKKYYIVRNWGINNISNLIEKMEKLFPGLVYEIVD